MVLPNLINLSSKFLFVTMLVCIMNCIYKVFLEIFLKIVYIGVNNYSNNNKIMIISVKPFLQSIIVFFSL